MPENEYEQLETDAVDLYDMNKAMPVMVESTTQIMPALFIDKTVPTKTAADGFVDYNEISIPADENEIMQEDDQFDRYLLLVKPRLEAVLAMRRRGLTIRQVAHNLGVPLTYFNKCIQTRPELFKVIHLGKLDHISMLENALAMRATGYSVKIPKQKVTRGGDIVEIEDTIYIPPDPQTLIFALVNQAPDQWKNKQDTNITGSIDHQFSTIFKQISEKESAKRQEELEPPE